MLVNFLFGRALAQHGYWQHGFHTLNWWSHMCASFHYNSKTWHTFKQRAEICEIIIFGLSKTCIHRALSNFLFCFMLRCSKKQNKNKGNFLSEITGVFYFDIIADVVGQQGHERDGVSALLDQCWSGAKSSLLFSLKYDFRLFSIRWLFHAPSSCPWCSQLQCCQQVLELYNDRTTFQYKIIREVEREERGIISFV